LVADALYPIKAHTLPAVCERYGLEPGTEREAFDSKTKYVMRRLGKLSDEQVLGVATAVVEDYPDDKLSAAIEQLDRAGRLVSDITRANLAEALNGFDLGGRRGLLELFRKHFPEIHGIPSYRNSALRLADDIDQHMVMNYDWSNSDGLEQVGFLTCSQARLFRFLEDVVGPIRRDEYDQEQIVGALNPILNRDGYTLAVTKRRSGYPVYSVQETTPAGSRPADALISERLSSFDEGGVHAAWQKALDRRTTDPEGAITAAKTLLETVCKHILDGANCTYGDNDDLPKLYNAAAVCLNLAPSLYSEQVFKSILGNCQSVVGLLASIRNKLGDSHGQGKRHVKPKPRHAELAVNLAGSVAMFLVSTWHERQGKSS
jgi:hypothetical protein